jgi:DNA-directed RNA polymerase subunit RPC12/RpoP
MKKEDLIKKAAERGMTITEEQAEKYVNLSDEELENLDVSGGCKEAVTVYICNNCHIEFEETEDERKIRDIYLLPLRCTTCQSLNVSYKRIKES